MSQHVIAIWTSPRSHADEARGVVRELAALTLAEPGCLRFEVWEAGDLSGRFVLIEEYRDEAARDAHMATEHFARLVLDRAVTMQVQRDVRVHHMLGY